MFRTFVFCFMIALLLAGNGDAQAQCRGGAVSGTPSCPPEFHPSPSPEPMPAPVDPAYEALQQNIKIYNDRFAGLYEHTRLLDGYAGMAAPASESELSSRIDTILSTVWPEYRANTLKVDLYRRQFAFYDKHNRQLGDDTARMNRDIAALQAGNPVLAQEAQQAESALKKSQELEAELTPVGMKSLNNLAAERLAMAYLMILAPEPGVTPERLTGGTSYEGGLPGAQQAPYPAPAAGFAAMSAEEAPPETPGEMKAQPPAASAPLPEKFAFMQSMSAQMSQDMGDLRLSATQGDVMKQQYATLKAENARTADIIKPLVAEEAALKERLNNARDQLTVSEQNTQNAARIIMKEMVTDLALTVAVREMKKTAEEILGAEGLIDKVPTDKADAVIKMAQEGGKLLLPHGGFEKQWETFVETQKQTLSVLDRAEGFMKDAARLAATGTPEETEELMERVFGSVKWQAAQYVRTVGASVIPDDDDNSSLIDKAYERYIDRQQGKQSGE